MNEFIDNLPPLRSPRKPKPKQPPIPDWVKQRYIEAHQKSFSQAVKEAGHTFKATMPDTRKAGGLQNAVIKYLTWEGWYANRISSTGRKIGNKWIPGNTKKGTADLHLIVKSVHISAEVKIGADRMSEDQHSEKSRVEKAGGKYWVIKTFEDFLQKYDSLFVT